MMMMFLTNHKHINKEILSLFNLVRIRFTVLLQQYSSGEIRKHEQRKNDFLNKHNIRYQEYTAVGKSINQGIISFPHVIIKVVDYNILSHVHMMTHIRNYKKCPRECLNWSYRKNVLKDEFLTEQADIFCLQEVEGAHMTEFFEPLQKIGYDALYVPRGEDKPDGCAILYKTSKFKISDFCPIHFFRPEVYLLDRPNVGMVVRLELRDHPGNEIVVANTHLLYNPRRADIKLSQLQILLAETDRLAYNYNGVQNKYHPVILTGDLNVNADSDLIVLLSNRYLNCHKMLTERQQHDKQGERIVPAALLHQYLRISDSCQYIDVVKAREKGLQDPRLTKDLHKILNVHRVYPDLNIAVEPGKRETLQYQTTTGLPDNESDQEHKHTSGHEILRHDIPLMNVFSHPQLDMSGHKSTQKEKKLNIYDYMFYSCNEKGKDVYASPQIRPGELHLLSRLRLPSVSDYYSKIKFIPNYAFGSDHFPLVAKFLLPVQ